LALIWAIISRVESDIIFGKHGCDHSNNGINDQNI